MLNRKGTIETLVVSIAGNPPTDQDWDQLFTRMAGTCTSYVTPSLLLSQLMILRCVWNFVELVRSS